MLKPLLASTAMLLALAGQVTAQEATGVQSEETPPPAAGAAPDAEGTGSTTGGVTAPAKEMLPDETTEAPIDGQALDAAGSAGANPPQPATGSADAVGPDMVRELYEMALAQQKKAASPTEPKSEEAKQAEQKAIAGHRDAFFARLEEARG